MLKKSSAPFLYDFLLDHVDVYILAMSAMLILFYISLEFTNGTWNFKHWLLNWYPSRHA